MKFDFWLKRQKTSYEAIIKKNNLNSYEELVEYARGLSLSPPDESDVTKYFQKEEKPRKGRSNSSVRSSIGSSKANSSRSGTKSKPVQQEHSDSIRRGSKNAKKSKSLDDKKDRDDRNNSSGE